MNRTFYLLMMEDWQAKNVSEPRIITEMDYKEKDIEKKYPYLRKFLKSLARKGDKIIYESPFDNRKIVIELIEYDLSIEFNKAK